jgi:hypothetical protein
VPPLTLGPLHKWLRTRKGYLHCTIGQQRCFLMQFLRMRPSIIGEYSNKLGQLRIRAWTRIK